MKNCALFLAVSALVTAAPLCRAHGANAQVPAPPAFAVAGPVAALPPGTSELRFAEMFRMPVGPFGLEPSATLLALEGRPVRLVGYMASTEMPVPGRLVLVPRPVALGDEDESLADDLPATAVFVHLSGSAAAAVLPNLSGLIQLQGRLALGAEDEPSGHVSSIRLILDEASSSRLVASSFAQRFAYRNHFH